MIRAYDAVGNVIKTHEHAGKFNKECAGVDDESPKYTECFNKRSAIGGKLSGFVMLVQQELNFLGDPAQERAQLQEQQDKLSESQKAEILKQHGPEALDIDAQMKRSAGRRSDTRLHIGWANYWFTCLGRENDSECTAFKAALVKATGPGGVGLMDIDHPTHEGNEEAKHWHTVRINPSQKAEIRKQSSASVTPKPHKNEY